MAEGKFVRVYHEDLIANYAAIWDDDRALATWLRLLTLADKLWPTPPDMPRGVSRSALAKLVEVELVTLVAPHRFRLRGLDAQRQRQSEAGRAGAAGRWDKADAEPYAGGNAVRNPKPMPRTDPRGRAQSGPPSGTTSSSVEEEGSLRARGPIAVPVKGMNGETETVEIAEGPPTDVARLQRLAEEITQQPHVMANVFGGLGAKAVNEQLRPHGYGRVERAWRQIANRAMAEGRSFPTLRQLVFGADDILNPIPRADAQEQRADESRDAFERRVARTQAELRQLRGEPA